MRQIPQQMAALKAGQWQIGVGSHAARQDARHLWLRPDRQRRGGLRQGLRHEGAWSGRARPTLAQARAEGYATAPSKEAFFAECDVVSLHMRLVEATRGIVTAADLARMKPTALLVNTSRAALIEPGALVAGLARRAGRAWPPSTSMRRSRCSTPTIRCSRWRTSSARRISATCRARNTRLQFADIFDQIIAYAAGTPINVVNPEVLKGPRVENSQFIAGSSPLASMTRLACRRHAETRSACGRCRRCARSRGIAAVNGVTH